MIYRWIHSDHHKSQKVFYLKTPQKNQWTRRRENHQKESAEVNDLILTRFCLASCLKTSRINGVVERREDFRAILLDDLGFGVTFLRETVSQTLEFPVASDGCVWIGVSRNLWEGTVTAVPCDACVGLSDIISLARSSDRI